MKLFRKLCQQIGLGWKVWALLASASTLPAQILDTNFPWANAAVYATALQPDGKVLLGGSFGTLGKAPRLRLGRLNPDDTPDPTFTPEANGTVYCLALQPDGKILVGGQFTSLCGQARTNLGRLTADGLLEENFRPRVDLNGVGQVRVLAVQNDGKVLVGGLVVVTTDQSRYYLARLNADGSVDASFNPGPSAPVNTLLLQADGKILMGGQFTKLAGQTRVGLGRLNADGTLDTNFLASPDGTVQALALEADGRILFGGTFSHLSGLACNNLGRINLDGTVDATFNPGTDRKVETLAVQSNGKILVGGALLSLGGQPRVGLGRLNSDGTLDPDFNPGITGGSLEVYSLVLQRDGKVLVGGNFSYLAGQVRPYLGRLNNADAAGESLTFNGNTITWTRTGAAPEIPRTSFDISTNHQDWISLGAGTRVAGGWQVTGAIFPANSVIRARGFFTGGQNNGSSWFVEAGLGPPMIATQPSNRTNNAGAIASFTVNPAGTPPFTYQWLKDGTNLDDGGRFIGAHTSLLMLSNVFGGDRGGYSVVVTSPLGSVTSQVATLTVADPFLVASPVSLVTNLGGTVTFSVVAGCTPPFTFQWQFNGVNIAGATNASLSIANFSVASAGGYSVTVSNSAGGVTSRIVTLSSVDIAMFAGVIVNGPVGSNYLIQAAASLASTNWTTLTNVALPSQPYIYIDYSSYTNGLQFYRAVPQ